METYEPNYLECRLLKYVSRLINDYIFVCITLKKIKKNIISQKHDRFRITIISYISIKPLTWHCRILLITKTVYNFFLVYR